MRNMKFLFVLTGTALITTPVSAQFIGGTSPMDMNAMSSATLRARIDSNSLRNVARRGGSSAPVARSSTTILGSAFAGPAPNANTVIAPATLNYTSTSATRQEALGGLLSRTRRSNPSAAIELEKETRKNDFFKIYETMVRGDELRVNNLADVAASYVTLLWMVANEKPDFDNPAALRAMRMRVASVLSQSQVVKSPATRAAAAEEIKLLFVTISAGLNSARRDGTLSAYADGVNRMYLSQAGENLRAVRLTDEGFEK